MIQLFLLTIVGSLFIASNKKSHHLILMVLLQALALYPSDLELELNFIYALIFVVLPVIFVTIMDKSRKPISGQVRSRDFLIYTSLLVIVSSAYIMANHFAPEKLAQTLEAQRPAIDELWTIALGVFLFTIGILPRLKKS